MGNNNIVCNILFYDEMKKKSQIAMLYISAIYTLLFLVFVTTKYGWLPSISKSAYYLTPDGLDFLFFMFIFLACGAVMWASQSWLGALATPLLFIISIITGWNPEIENNSLQHIIHVIVTIAAISTIMVEVLRKSLKGRNPEIGVLMVLQFIVFSGFVFLLNMTNYVFWIEINCFVTIYIYYLREVINDCK